MRSRRLAGVVAALGLVAAVPAAHATTHQGAFAIGAKSCTAGFVHGVINGAEKCLRRGEFCAHAADRQYRRYGFQCTSQDARGNYHLT